MKLPANDVRGKHDVGFYSDTDPGDINKIAELLRNPMCNFVLNVGTRKLVKRKEFEQYLSSRREI